MKRRLTLIGAADSIGVPYTRDNFEHKGFFEMIEEKLAREYEVTSINCFHMSVNNDNEYIRKLISSDISLLEVKNTQNQMLRKCKYSGIYPYLELPKNFLNYYKIDERDAEIIVRDFIKKDNTIFIYSAFVNDLLKSRNLSLFKLLKPGRIKAELAEINIESLLGSLEKNIEKLVTLNSEIKIFMIGLFIPTRITYVRNSLEDFIYRINSSFDELSQKYKNVVLINNDNLTREDFNNIDFHPNRRGHIKIYHNFVAKLNDAKKE